MAGVSVIQSSPDVQFLSFLKVLFCSIFCANSVSGKWFEDHMKRFHCFLLRGSTWAPETEKKLPVACFFYVALRTCPLFTPMEKRCVAFDVEIGF